jgi:hypothetical protein
MGETDTKAREIEGLRTRIRQWQELYEERDGIGYDPKQHSAHSPEHRRYARITWDIHRIEDDLFASWDATPSRA